MTDIYREREREREKNRIFGVNGFEFYEVFSDIRTLNNTFYMMPGFFKDTTKTICLCQNGSRHNNRLLDITHY